MLRKDISVVFDDEIKEDFRSFEERKNFRVGLDKLDLLIQLIYGIK